LLFEQPETGSDGKREGEREKRERMTGIMGTRSSMRTFNERRDQTTIPLAVRVSTWRPNR